MKSFLLRLYIALWLVCIGIIGIAVLIANKLPHAMFAIADCGYNAEISIADWPYTRRLFRVTDNPSAMDWKPIWSPDGREIAYQSDTNNQRAIYIVDLATGARRPLTSSIENAMSPSWSPDGKQIAFTHLINGFTSPLFIADLFSGDIREFAVKALYAQPPAWSPNSQSLAFTDYGSGVGEILILDGTTGKTRNISNDPTAQDSDPAWSPDGKHLAFTSTRDNIAQLYIADVETGAIHNFSNDTTKRYSGFAWSPDRDHIAVIVNEHEVRIEDMAGNILQSMASPQIPLTTHAVSWSPDGAYLALASDPPGAYLVDLASGTRYAVMTSGCDFVPIAWMP